MMLTWEWMETRCFHLRCNIFYCLQIAATLSTGNEQWLTLKKNTHPTFPQQLILVGAIISRLQYVKWNWKSISKKNRPCCHPGDIKRAMLTDGGGAKESKLCGMANISRFSDLQFLLWGRHNDASMHHWDIQYECVDYTRAPGVLKNITKEADGCFQSSPHF